MSMKNEKRSNPRTEVQKRRPLKISSIVDATAKLLAAGAIVSGAFIANTYQAKMTSIYLINQREQAESKLRADMFSNLIGPVAGPYTEGAEIKPDRERLLVELLALNFHEHFEFKPLLKYVDERIAEEMSPDQAKKARDSLRSVARRVKDRQIAMLIKEGARQPYNLIIKYRTDIPSEEDYPEPAKKTDESNFIDSWASQERSQGIILESPDRFWTMNINFSHIDWEKQTVRVSVALKSNPSDKKEKYLGTSPKFTLTWYDFPLTDNTTLVDGNRFSLFINRMEESEQEVNLKLIWFPKDYFTARERPINYKQFLEKLGIDTKKDAKKKKLKVSDE